MSTTSAKQHGVKEEWWCNNCKHHDKDCYDSIKSGNNSCEICDNNICEYSGDHTCGSCQFKSN